MKANRNTLDVRTNTQPKRLRATANSEEIISSTMNATNRPCALVIVKSNRWVLPVQLHQSPLFPAAAHSTHESLLRTHVAGATTVTRKRQQPKGFGRRAEEETYLFRDAIPQHMNATHNNRSTRTLSQPNPIRASASREEIISSTMNATTRPNATVINESNRWVRPVPFTPVGDHFTYASPVGTHAIVANTDAQKRSQPKPFGQRAVWETYLFRDATLQHMNATQNNCSSRNSSQPNPIRASASREEIISSTMNAITRPSATVIVESHRHELPFHLHLATWVCPVALFDQMTIVRCGKMIVATTKSASPKRLRTTK
ncbi:hypothetical protein ESB00_17805 [Oleiharenicola lentus]|uniref:Uncharacterized protein n=1 Tax=Oleiharenicola lentus TaxID=2508720 RepID=A0A4V1M626_9BACT|nr:hypothetical protein [Oleiharenicola lentus]RXK53546.1 hypothetical protein ESB00_17805 [Oleiharenicola lentus]